MKTIKLIFVVVSVLCFTSWIASAQEAALKSACRADVEKFCKGVQPGKGRLAQCIKKHENELSPACKEGIAEGKEKAKEFVEACKLDMEKFCRGVDPGQGRVLKCLKDNQNKLSPECKAHFWK